MLNQSAMHLWHMAARCACMLEIVKCCREPNRRVAGLMQNLRMRPMHPKVCHFEFHPRWRPRDSRGYAVTFFAPHPNIATNSPRPFFLIAPPLLRSYDSRGSAGSFVSSPYWGPQVGKSCVTLVIAPHFWGPWCSMGYVATLFVPMLRFMRGRPPSLESVPGLLCGHFDCWIAPHSGRPEMGGTVHPRLGALFHNSLKRKAWEQSLGPRGPCEFRCSVPWQNLGQVCV